MNETNLPLEDLKKFGLIDKENQFNTKLSLADVTAFKNGSTLHVEDDKQRLSFALKDDNTRLETNVYFKDIVNHKELSTAELLQLSFDKSNQYKVIADYGTITKIEKGYHAGNNANEMTTFVEVENERGKNVFFGNDLQEKMKDFQVGDKIQIENTAINKVTISAETEEGVKDFVKYDNVFNITDFDEEKKKFQSKLFEYDPASKNVTSIDTTNLEIKSINGINLNAKQNERLRKGKELKLDDDLSVQLSPNSNNAVDLKSTARMLLVASIAIDGGLSTIIVKGVMKLASMAKDNKQQIDHAKFTSELEKSELLKQAKTEMQFSAKAHSPETNKDNKISKEEGVIDFKNNAPSEVANREIKLKKDESFSGILIDKGEANYLHDKENGKSFFVTVLNDKNEEKTVWAIDFKEKVKDIPVFQNVEIKFLGKQDVEIKVPVKNEEGKEIAVENKTVHRNSFEINQNDSRIISHKEAQNLKSNSEKLNQMKSFLQSKATLYPENKSIISSINIIDKFVDAKPITIKESTKNLQVVDYDTFEDANKKKEIEKSIDIDTEKNVSKGRGR